MEYIIGGIITALLIEALNTASESDVLAGIARWVREHPEHTREA